MEKDKRYGTVRKLLESGHIGMFKEIFETIPPSRLAKDLGFHYDRLKRLTEDVGDWTIKDLYTIANLIGVPGRKITDLVNNQLEAKKRKPNTPH